MNVGLALAMFPALMLLIFMGVPVAFSLTHVSLLTTMFSALCLAWVVLHTPTK